MSNIMHKLFFNLQYISHLHHHIDCFDEYKIYVRIADLSFIKTLSKYLALCLPVYSVDHKGIYSIFILFEKE